MSDKSKSYLAAEIISESHIVTYRSLSRALKVHSNVAKEMLFDFHYQETSKKPGSVHATYLLSGLRQPPEPSPVNGIHEKDGDDDLMQSSPLMSSSMPNQEEAEESIPIRSITLVKEEHLEGMTIINKRGRKHNGLFGSAWAQLMPYFAEVKAQYEMIASLHIYSLEPSSLQNLQLLSDSNRQISVQYASEDPLQVCTQYGTIRNPNVKRRTRRRPPPAATAIPASAQATTKVSAKPQTNKSEEDKKQSQDSTKTNSEPKPPEQPAPKPTAKNERRTSTDSKPTTRPSSLKRDKSDIFKSFAKAKSSLKREHTGSSAGGSPAPSVAESAAASAVEDAPEPMKDASDDEQEEDDDTPEISSKERESERKSKLERQERLKKMMDDDDEEDEPMEDATTAPTADEQAPDNGKPEASQETPAEEPTVVVSGGRRRGKRRVMKKKTVKDEEGYLVTREEPGWESFSEEEPKAQKAKTPAPTSSASKAKKSGAKPGQGNLMSFFSKK
ncbi:MAG: hypothetical protein M1835_001680 [Candelina submexicana]|nr:MAG: hypothetical protein M1835_001680 [Candelina submexicana]